MTHSILTEPPSPDDFSIPGEAFHEAAHANGRRVSETEIHRLASGFGIDDVSARRVFWLAGARPEPAAAVILIGGKSMRMGTDKAFMLLDGESIASRLYKKLAPYFDEVFFSAARSQSSPVTGVRCVYDRLPGRGPLAGLATGLSASPHRVNFVIACDIPNVDISLVRMLLSTLEEVEIAVPAFSSMRTEPLFGAYDRSVGATAERLLLNGVSKVISVYDHHHTRVLSATNTGWYMNLNSPEDVRLYLESHRSGANG
ncbi:molybdenum cofactor guanylyltransferase [bacterium]|nr:molybdenum cofactor guanylyltransferase [candidate division CSSED10-310 bacterium]